MNAPWAGDSETAMKQHRRRVRDLVAEYRALPRTASATRRGLTRKIATEGAAHGSLSGAIGPGAAAGWEDIAGAAALAWRMDAALPESLLAAIEAGLEQEERLAGVVAVQARLGSSAATN